MIIRAIEPSYLDFYWGRIFPQVRDALKYSNNEQGEYHIWENILKGRYILMVAIEDGEVIGHCTMMPVDHPNKRILDLITVGGTRLNEWLDLILIEIYNVARDLKCSAVYTCGRKGWERILKDFKPQYVICIKEIL